jgi:integrase
MIDGRISQANGRLKAARVGVMIERPNDSNRLHLRATFPPKPTSKKTEPYQQRLSLGYHANPAGLKLAEQEARKIGALLDCGEFSWVPYLKTISATPQTVAEWAERFEADYFQRRARNPKSETTWRTEYRLVLSQLPQTALLTIDLLERAIRATTPDSRTRTRYVMVCNALARFAGLSVDFKGLKGNYSPYETEPRDLPNDRAIAEWFYKIPNAAWQWAYGILATYGLRNHELFYLDFSKMPVLLVVDGAKTVSHRVYPLYPEWVDEFGLKTPKLPPCTGKDNSALGNRVTVAFNRYDVPHSPYDLRHAWAVRSIGFIPIELAAQQMGHSVAVHTRTYHKWITEEVHDRHFRLLMERRDRPKAPQLSK